MKKNIIGIDALHEARAKNFEHRHRGQILRQRTMKQEDFEMIYRLTPKALTFICPKCSSTKVLKTGKKENGEKFVKCGNCKKKYTVDN